MDQLAGMTNRQNAKSNPTQDIREKTHLRLANEVSPHDTEGNSSWGRKKSFDHSSKSSPRFAENHDTIPGLGYLSLQKGGRSRYVGQSFWAYVGDDVRYTLF